MIKDYKLYLGDNIEVMKKEIKDESIDFILTSPPYDDLRTYNDTCVWNFEIFKNVAKELYRVLKEGGVVVWVVGDCTKDGDESGTSFRQALYFKEIGFKLGDTMIWNKGSFAFPSNHIYHQVFEYMFVFSKGYMKTVNLIRDRKNIYVGEHSASGRRKNGERNIRKGNVRNLYGARFNVWNIPIGGGHCTKDKIAYEHPAIFPEKLAKDHILSWSNEGDVVLDPFCGSGTVGKMALLNDRNFIGIEKVEKYYELAKRRIDNSITDIFDL
jgi:site-specific DNA-methyltransferase (adenine-specific)